VLTEAPPVEVAPEERAVPSIARRLWLRWERDNLLRNTVFIMATTVVNGAVGYVYWIAAARMGDPAEVGVATSLIAILFLTSMATNLGMGPALIQALPRANDDRRWSCLVNVAILAGLVTGVAGSTYWGTLAPNQARWWAARLPRSDRSASPAPARVRW